MKKHILTALLLISLIITLIPLASADETARDVIIIGNERYEVSESGTSLLGLIDSYEGEKITIDYDGAQKEFSLQAYEYNTSDDGTGASICYSPDGIHFAWNIEHILFCDEELRALCTNGQTDEITLYPMFKCPFHTYDENDVKMANEDEPEDIWIYHSPAPNTCGEFGNIACRECWYCGIMEIECDEGYKLARYHDVFVDSVSHDYHYTANSDGTHKAICQICLDRFTEPHHYTDGVCDECGDILFKDINGDGALTLEDAEFLLNHILFSDETLSVNTDYNFDGQTTPDDISEILHYLLFKA